MGLEEISAILDSNFTNHVVELQKLVRQPSVSVEQFGTKECAELIANWMSRIHFDEVEVFPGNGNPIILGQLYGNSDSDKTLLIYGAYDSNPVETEKWSIPPFEGRIVEHPEKGRILVGRGVNNKMKIAGILNAIDAVKTAESDLPYDIIVVFDGEEEMFSPTLPQFIKAYQPVLQKADALYMPFGSQNSQGVSRVQLGYKGVLYLELTASAKNWGRGPANHEIHSMHRPAIDNPIWYLISALKSMVSEDSNTVLIEGFMDEVVEPDGDFLELVDILANDFDLVSYKKSQGAKILVGDESDPRKLLERLLFTCQINIDGIWSGYTGVGPEAVIPSEAKAKLDIRLIPDQTTDSIFMKIHNHLKEHGFEAIEIEKLASVESCRTSVKEEIAQSLIRAYDSLDKKVQVWPTSLATIPLYLFNQPPLNLPFATGCVGSGGHSHGFDEFFMIDGTDKMDGIAGYEKLIASLIWEYRKQK